MAYEDKITRGGEITATGDFITEGGVFYIMLVPKTETAANATVLNVKLSDNAEPCEFPFVAGMWNPVVVNKVNIVQQNLTDYRIFYGVTR